MSGNAEQADQVARLDLPDGSEYGSTGRVDFTAATIDPRTGSVSARAVFPNPDAELVPGQFVRIRMVTEQLDQVYRIPQQAISQGTEGARVFVVDSSNQARARQVELGPTMGNEQVVLTGLESGDRLVVSGLNNLNDGMAVEPERVDAEQSR